MGEARTDTFVVDMIKTVLRRAKKLSFHYWVTKKIPDTFFFVDRWVLGWLAASGICYIVSLCITNLTVTYVIAVASAIRVFECFTYLCYNMLFPEANKGEHALRSYRRSAILLISNYLEIILWFATWYALLGAQGQLTVNAPATVAIVRESLAFMVANSTNSIQDMKPFAWFVVTVQNFLGLFMTVVVVSRFISLLPRPTSGDPEEQAPTRSID